MALMPALAAGSLSRPFGYDTGIVKPPPEMLKTNSVGSVLFGVLLIAA